MLTVIPIYLQNLSLFFSEQKFNCKFNSEFFEIYKIGSSHNLTVSSEIDKIKLSEIGSGSSGVLAKMLHW